jgi:quercetin dioxygenase-like cupin family protein
MLDQTWQSGDIVVIEPGEVSSFTALTDATLVVVKVPGAKDDKYLAD